MKTVPANRYVIFFGLVVLGLVADLWTKSYMFSWLGEPSPQGEDNTYWIIDGVCGFQTSLNPGALFGLGQGGVHWFAAFSAIAFVAILIWLFVFGAARSRLLTVSLGCIGAGTLGNLYDRLALHGLEWKYTVEGLHQVGEPVHAVRDWILVMFGSWTWPNFNIADSLLVSGAILLGIHAFFVADVEQKAKKAETPQE